jgi:hypothetical protein
MPWFRGTRAAAVCQRAVVFMAARVRQSNRDKNQDRGQEMGRSLGDRAMEETGEGEGTRGG